MRRLKDEYDNMANMSLGSADPQTAAPEAEKPWTSWYNNLMDSAKARKAKAQGVVDQSQVTKEDLDGLSEDRNQRTVASGLQGAANQFLSVGGEAPKSNLNETFDALNKGQTSDLDARQKLATQAGADVKSANEDIGNAMRQPFEMQKMQSEQEESDPNSNASQSARAFIEQNIGVKLPPNLSAKQLSSSSTIQPLMAKWNAERAEANLKASQDFQVGRDRDNQRFQAGQGALQRADSAANRQLEVTSREKIAGANLAENQRKEQEKQTEKNIQMEIPGYGIARNEKAAQAGQKAVVLKENLTRAFDELRALVQPNGKTNIDVIGDTAAKVDAKLTEIRLKMKEVNDLGALAGPDWKIITSELPDLTGFKAGMKNVLPGFSDPFIPIDQTLRSSLNDIETNLKTLTRPQKPGEARPISNVKLPQPGEVRVFGKNDEIPDP